MASAPPPSYDEMMKQSASAPPDPSMIGYPPTNAPYPINTPFPANPPYPTGDFSAMPYPQNAQMMQQTGQPMPGYGPNYQYPPQGMPQPGYTQTIVYSNTSQPLGNQQGPQQGGVIIHQIVTPMSFKSSSMVLVCPSCQKSVSTMVKREITCGTHVCAIIILFVFWPLCWIPYCMNAFKSATHSCPSCGNFIGKRSFC